MSSQPWEVPDELWVRLEPLIPKKPRRFRYPGRRPLDDRCVLSGILFVLCTGVGWERLPKELGCGSGMTCWRRLRDWQDAGVWKRLHALLLAELQAAGAIDWSRAVVDASYIQAKKGAPRPARARSTAAAAARSTTS
jgi:transposase